jgi:ParB family chromosome partitioning protein
MLANKIVMEQLSVREAEKLTQKKTNESESSVKTKKIARPDRDTQRLEEEMSTYLGTRVEIKPSVKGGGKLIIEYADHDQLDELLNKLKKSR